MPEYGQPIYNNLHWKSTLDFFKEAEGSKDEFSEFLDDEYKKLGDTDKEARDETVEAFKRGEPTQEVDPKGPYVQSQAGGSRFAAPGDSDESPSQIGPEYSMPPRTKRDDDLEAPFNNSVDIDKDMNPIEAIKNLLDRSKGKKDIKIDGTKTMRGLPKGDETQEIVEKTEGEGVFDESVPLPKPKVTGPDHPEGPGVPLRDGYTSTDWANMERDDKKVHTAKYPQDPDAKPALPYKRPSSSNRTKGIEESLLKFMKETVEEGGEEEQIRRLIGTEKYRAPMQIEYRKPLPGDDPANIETLTGEDGQEMKVVQHKPPEFSVPDIQNNVENSLLKLIKADKPKRKKPEWEPMPEVPGRFDALTTEKLPGGRFAGIISSTEGGHTGNPLADRIKHDDPETGKHREGLFGATPSIPPTSYVRGPLKERQGESWKQPPTIPETPESRAQSTADLQAVVDAMRYDEDVVSDPRHRALRNSTPIEESLLKLMKDGDQRLNALAEDKVKKPEEEDILVADGDKTGDAMKRIAKAEDEEGHFDPAVYRARQIRGRTARQEHGQDDDVKAPPQEHIGALETFTPGVKTTRPMTGWKFAEGPEGKKQMEAWWKEHFPDRETDLYGEGKVPPPENPVEEALFKLMEDIKPADVGMAKKNALEMDKAGGMPMPKTSKVSNLPQQAPTMSASEMEAQSKPQEASQAGVGETVSAISDLLSGRAKQTAWQQQMTANQMKRNPEATAGGAGDYSQNPQQQQNAQTKPLY